MNLTRYGIYIPGKTPLFYNEPSQAGVALAQSMTPYAQPSMVANQDVIPDVLDPTEQYWSENNTLPMGPGFPAPTVSDPPSAEILPPAPSALPTMYKPTFQEASQDQFGNVTQHTPGLTKLGTLLKIIGAATQGGLAGRAASERAVIQSGGRRSGGFGLGFEAAEEEPIRRTYQQQRLQAGQLENEQRRASIAMLPWMIGLRNAQLQNMNAETQAQLAHAAYWKSAQGQKDQLTLQQLHAAAVERAINERRDPNADPDVQAYADAITSVQRQTTPHADTPFADWRMQNPQAPISDWFDMQHRSAAKYRRPDENKASPTQFGEIERRKTDRYRKLHAFKWNQETGDFEDAQGRTITPEEYADEEQEIEDNYRAEIRAAGGSPAPFSYSEYRAGQGKQGNGKALDAATATAILAEAGNDKNKARQIARQRGFRF